VKKNDDVQGSYEGTEGKIWCDEFGNVESAASGKDGTGRRVRKKPWSRGANQKACEGAGRKEKTLGGVGV